MAAELGKTIADRPTKFYINESLAAYKRRLFGELNTFKNRNKWQYSIYGRRMELASFRFEDEAENEDQVQLLLIVRMLKSVTVMAWQCCYNLRRRGQVEDEKVWRFRCGESRVLRPRPRIRHKRSTSIDTMEDFEEFVNPQKDKK